MLFNGFEQKRIEAPETEINLRIGGDGPPLLLLHGYPQTHAMWHKVAPKLAEHFTVVTPDLRGYGDSGKPETTPDHYPYSKRASAADLVAVMQALGFEEFLLAGHDRGGRVAHRLTLDHPDRVRRLAVLDIVPTHKIFSDSHQGIAMAYYHWFFLAQPNPLPETLIGRDPDFYYGFKTGSLSPQGNSYFDPEAYAEYQRCWNNPAMILASCEDYRAAATIDLEHDEADLATKIACPLLAIWGGAAVMEAQYDVLACWRDRAADVRGQAIPDCGHFLAEEKPDETARLLLDFFLEE
ncbi:alpha/beta hydrolase [Hwanghaeella grinnelliae]|uniref:Alpha/beta hydrolase n=1 Tax=Hwanghaeella grinnelliae TaxID=2500179 RepID=A0A3S2Y467_9PROT|nr:alpha/beta hydrolase [Hwanghaeella grinnelliae]RVU38064.1 alpha/beta hydrolase [Hwanghaeella grinnelliae]